jgi:hypothetical protein
MINNNSTNSSKVASSIPEVLDEQDQVIMRGRIKSPAQLAGAYQYLFTSDLGSSRARAKVQSQVDGDPPFSSDQDRLLGLGGRTNANWGYASQSQQDIERPYNDVFDSIAEFGTTPIKAGFADELSRQQWAPIIAEEISRMIRNWPKFTYNRLLCVHLFTMFGVAFTYREDKFDWRFKVTSLQWLKVPRRTEATIEDQDFFCARVLMSPVELQKKIKDPASAELAGWNVKAVQAAIEETAQPAAIDTSNPETLQETVKDQDYFSGAGAIVVDVVHGWVREMDGSISHVIGRYDGQGDFLYKCEGMYSSMSEFVTAYTDGVGSNGDFYSLRGNAWRGFNSSLYLNLMTCKAVDMANWSSTPHLKATDEDALIDTLIRPSGPYNIISSQAEFVEIQHVPFQQNLIPMIQEIKGIFSMRSRQAGGANRYTGGGATPRTAEEVKTEAAIDGQLTTAGMDLYFLSWLNDFKEIVRRAKNEDLSAAHPGGAEVFKMRKRCAERGVPIEAIYNIDVDAIEINRGVGKGSAQERRAVFSQLMPNIGSYDPKGQQILLRQYTASLAGTSFANLLVPPEPGTRPPVDVQIANMENALMSLGQPAVVEPNQDHTVHVATHLSKLAEINGALAEQQMEFAPAIQLLGPIWRHTTEHMAYIDQKNPLYKTFKEALSQIEEVVVNGEKKLAAEAQREQENPELANGESLETPLSVLRNSADAGARLDVMAKRQELGYQSQKQQLEIAKKRQDLAYGDAKRAQELKQAATQKPAA